MVMGGVIDLCIHGLHVAFAPVAPLSNTYSNLKFMT